MIVRPLVTDGSWDKWVSERPRIVQELIATLPPDRLYLLDGKHRVTIYSYGENGTVTVDLTGEFNLVTFSRRVFGISPEQLIECDPLPEDSPVGDMAAEAGLSEAAVLEYLIPKLIENAARKAGE